MATEQKIPRDRPLLLSAFSSRQCISHREGSRLKLPLGLSQRSTIRRSPRPS
ncbi:MAG TPA: hypothetical protein V6D02_16515 [Candidatus Obscuribacterales bacterium]